MIRISALTGDTDSSSSDEDDSHVTQEAQETIALSEYMRALRLKNGGQVNVAESLFGELLETQVLNEATKDAKDNKLFHVKYSCLKNLGLICAERGDNKEAIEYLLKASELDDKDVALMNRLGKLALTMDQAHIAQMAFETCLRQNPNHWPAADGMLKVLCLREDFAEAYGWALEWYTRNPNYQFGLDVILEIREKFKFYGLEFFERLWKTKFVDTHLKRTNMDTVFPKYIIPDPEPPEAPDLTGFHLDESNLSWLSVGQLIVRMYKHFEGTSAIGYDLTLDEWLGRNDNEAKSDAATQNEEEIKETGPESNSATKPMEFGSDECGSKENSSSNSDPSALANFVVPPVVVGGSAEVQTSAEVSGTEESDGGATAAVKPKASRRRGGGDLIGLEQWGWHRNKRYSQRKKSIDKTDSDTTVNGMLRKALAKFFEETFEANLTPFASTFENAADIEMQAESLKPSSCPATKTTVEAFLLKTQDGFVEFMNELKEKPYFDLMVLTRTWCQYVARYWDQPIPEVLQEIFKTLYMYHLNHWDINSWNHLERNDFQSVFRMTLFYLELFHDTAMRRAKDGYTNELDQQWKILFDNFIFHSGYFEPDADTEAEFSQLQIRWHWLKHLQARFVNDLDLAVDFLCAIEQMIGAATICLPNLGKNNRIDMAIIAKLKVRFERNIRLSTVRRLYREELFDQMVPILVDSLQNMDWTANPIILSDDSATLPPTVQFEMLLECYWQLESPAECLVWCEACLGYSLFHFFKALPDTHLQTKWGESVTFVLTYLVGLFEAETACIVERMGRFGSRLVQNICSIVVHQLDSPYDKNHNPSHAIDIKLPWVLLHKLIQRDEDLQYAKKRRAAYTNTAALTDSQEEVSLPASTMMFFTVHEFLGVRAWCTHNNGQMLLYVMDMVADHLRTPAMDRHRDILAEYLEQVTYCLYGYPAKRARARHIEEHDACNIDLTWPRALQLFDLYRPDSLPEFNSYKNDSISTDMEQLLQRIVALLPPEIDLSPLTEPVNEYITGSSPELVTCTTAQPLPARIECIHYLLADHYFKNRDMVKSVKYYVLDLATCPGRFDAWAGLALSKASVLETKLNACTAIATNEFLSQCEESLRCFQQCLRLDNRQVPLWIEYGNFAYIMHSFCSRSLKQASETLSMERFEFLETNKEQCLKIAADCFTTVNNANSAAFCAAASQSVADTSPSTATTEQPTIVSANRNQPNTAQFTNGNHSSDDSHDEKWLYHYMLGKVAEKRKDPPEEVIAHYTESAKCLYEHNASFPFKISHSSPQHLSVEALEVYYRITATIVKYLEQHSTIPRMVGRMFIRVLREVNASPFALNQAKIDDHSINALKRKISMAADASQAKKVKEDAATIDQMPSHSDMQHDYPKAAASPDIEIIEDSVEMIEATEMNANTQAARTKVLDVHPLAGMSTEENQNPSRRGSQESNMTTTTNGTATTTTTTGSSETSSSSSSDSSSSESISSDDSDEDSSDEDSKNADTPLSENELESIYKTCIKNLEECVTRFPEHYKSIYRLVNIYLHAPDRIRDLKRCKQLLLGTYMTGLNNPVQGLFVERKLNNFFNGVWRIPSPEIDRPGSFAAHLSKCTIVLMEVLRLSADHKVLLELALQLQRNPDSDKRYIKDAERRELFQQAISFCTQSFRQLLKEHGVDRRNDGELILLLLDTYKAHKKYLKYTAQKECPFASLLSDAYRVYLEGKLGNARLPENLNATEYAIRFCQHEIGLRKNLAKNGGALPAPAQPESFLPAHVLRSIIHTPAPTPTPTPAVSTQPITEATVTIVTATPATVVQATPVCTTAPISSTVTVPSLPSIRVATTSISMPAPSVSILNTMSITPCPVATNTQSTPGPLPATTPSPRPRGRPPGSKNSTPSASASAAASAAALANSNLLSALPYGKLDPATMAALIGIYSNPSLMPSMVPPYTDPAMSSLMKDYFQISGMSSLMSGSNPTSMLPNTSTGRFQPAMPAPPSKLPMFDINSLISSAAEKMNPSTSMSPSTVISIGSGQLTITPSTMQQSSPRSNSNTNKPKKQFSAQLDPMPTGGPSLFTDMPGITMNKVKAPPVKQTSLLKTNVGIPKDLPKSLTITPAPPLGMVSQQSSPKLYPSMQYPQVTMQPEPILYPKARAPKPAARPKKTSKNQNPLAFNPMAPSSVYKPYATPSSLYQMSATSTATSTSPYTTTSSDLNHMAVMSQYADLLKNIDPMHAATLLSQLEQMDKYTRGKSAPKQSTTAANQPTKARLSVKQLQSMQNQPNPQSQLMATGSGGMSMTQTTARKPSAISTGKQTSISKGLTNKFTMPMDLQSSRAMTSPYGLLGSSGGSVVSTSVGSPVQAHSPLKSPVLPPPVTIQPQVSPGHGHISPSKTLQQILAERQKALNDANNKQQMQQQRTESASGSSGSSKSSRKPENIIILD